jgi:hypothetical protein
MVGQPKTYLDSASHMDFIIITVQIVNNLLPKLLKIQSIKTEIMSSNFQDKW